MIHCRYSLIYRVGPKNYGLPALLEVKDLAQHGKDISHTYRVLAMLKYT